LPALAKAKEKARRTQCLSNIHQIEVALNIYASQYNDKVPVWIGGHTAWDLPDTAAQPMLRAGLTKKTFYCPGLAPRFTDLQDWVGPNPSGQTTGAASTLWDYGDAVAPPEGPYHVVGYLFAFNGGTLIATNQNKTLQPESYNDSLLGTTVTYGVSDRVLMADVTVSPAGSVATPGYLHPENNYNNIHGGFQWGGVGDAYTLYHTSAHLNGAIPAGGFIGYKDGHADWRLFQEMVIRNTQTYTFWW